MAVGWIKFRKSLQTDGRVRKVARECGEKKTTIIGAVGILWMIADEHATDDGVLTGYIAEDINNEVEIEGFCEALPADWMDLTGESVRLPNYLEHNGDTAKKRAESTKRKQKQRDTTLKPCHADVTESCDKSVTREDKSREDKSRKKDNPPKSPKGGSETDLPSDLDPAFRTGEFRQVWADWVEHRKQKRSKLTTVAIRQQVKKLNEMGPERSTKALIHSMTNGWSGIFEPDARGHPRNDSGSSIDVSEYEKFLSAGETSG